MSGQFKVTAANPSREGYSTLPLTCRKRRAGVAAYGPRGAMVAALNGRTQLSEGVGLRDGQGRGAGAGWWNGGDDVTLLGRSPPILTRLGRHVLQHTTCLLWAPASASKTVH